jgi:transporter family protein
MNTWWFYALISAFAAAATAILAKVGVEGVPSNLATALRTVVVLVFAWLMVLVTGQHREVLHLSRRTIVFFTLSGVATGISWLAYFRALQLGPASRVAPVDKASLALTIVFAAFFLKEPISWRVGLGAALMVGGTLLTLSGR